MTNNIDQNRFELISKQQLKTLIEGDLLDILKICRNIVLGKLDMGFKNIKPYCKTPRGTILPLDLESSMRSIVSKETNNNSRLIELLKKYKLYN